MNRSSNRKSRTIPSEIKSIEEMCTQLIEEVKSFDYDEDSVFSIHLALEEALNNAARHGNKLDPEKTVEVQWSVDEKQFEIIITDQGQGFDPLGIPDPRTQENLLKLGGRGVLLMQAYMDFVEYLKGGRSVHMIKYKDGRQAGSAGKCQ